MKKAILLYAAFVLCVLTFSNLHAQTPGLIVRPTSSPYSSVLDPNQDGFTSPTTSGFVTTDVGTGYSEIPYKIVPPFKLEPTADLMRGPSDRFSDLVRLSADESGMYVYNDGTNMLFRLRLGDIISGSKGYSILIDADQKFGATGPYADPNYQAATTGINGNPGFEFEVVLETNFRIAIYNVDGTSSPTLITSYPIASNSQISLSISSVSGTPDYFYDFYVPLSALTSSAATITATTPIRISATTVMDPGPAIGGPKSDIYGYDGTDYMSAWESVINGQPAFTPNDVKSSGTGITAVCTAAPTLNSPISTGTVTLSGTWTESNAAHAASTATITLYKTSNGTTTVAGTTTVSTGGTWSIAGITAAAGDVFYAKAQSTGESSCLQSNSVVVPLCATITSQTGFAVTCATIRGLSGTRATGTSIKIYTVTSAGYTVFATDNSGTYKITYPTTTTWEYQGANSQNNDPCGGGAADVTAASYAVTTQATGQCESDYIYTCISGSGGSAMTQTATPTITQTALYSGGTTVSGTAAVNATVRLFKDGALRATTTANASGTYSFTGLSLNLNEVVDVYAQSTGQCVSAKVTRTVTCFTNTPIITTNSTGNLTAGATAIAGTAVYLSGTTTTVSVYNSSNVLQGTATVQSNGTWSVAVSVTAGTSYYATAQKGTCSISTASATVSALAATTVCPTITGSYTETSTTVSGTLSGSFSGTVYLYEDGINIGSTTVSSATTWSITPSSNLLYPGGVLTATTQTTGASEKTDCAGSVTISCASPTTPAVSPVSIAVSTSTGKTVFTISSSQSGVLYTLEDLSGVDKSTSVFGTGSSVTVTSYAFLTPGTYNLRVSALKLSGNNCSTATTAITLIVGDNDGDGVPDVTDIDDDNDGILDTNETATYDATGDADGDGIPNYKDTTPGTGLPSTDSNSDGIIDTYDTDKDGIINQFDLDADNDGIPDIVENGGTDTDNDGKVDGTTDVDLDGLRDAVDANTAGSSGSNGLILLDMDGDGVPNYKDLDTDGDGILDTRESGLGLDANNNGMLSDDAGYVGGTDGWSDAVDALSSLNLTNTDNSGNPNYRDIDSDNDGIVDIIEAQTTTAYLTPLNIDLDGDGIDKQYDNNTAAFGGNANNGLTPVNTDGTDLADYLDGDSDNDGYPDTIEGHDTNGDNVPDVGSPAANGVPSGTTDADNDGLLDGYDNNTSAVNPTNGTIPTDYPNVDGGTSERDWRETANTDTDGLSNLTDIDDDNDGITDVAECGGIDPLGDADGDGIYNYLDPSPGGSVPTFVDANGDGISDAFDADRDGVINSLDLDSDNDGIPDIIEAGGIDANGDGKADVTTDTDGDGLVNTYDTSNGGITLSNVDTDGDGIANAEDLDSDNDGIPDVVEASGTDVTNDGQIDAITDTNGDGWADAVTGTSNALIVAVDSNSDGKADSYTKGDFDGDKIMNPYDLDSDGDGILDVREAGFGSYDTNSNGLINASDASYADVNKDGWADAIDALASLGLLNTDNNGQADYVDIDADNDGITDNIEGQATASYQAPLGTDADKDGIDDRYDSNTAVFGSNTTNGITPVNTDGDALPDYRDLDSDNDTDPDRIEGNDLNLNQRADDTPASIPTTDTDADGLLDFWESNVNSGPVVTIVGFGGTGLSGKSTAQKTLAAATDRDWRNASFSLTAYTVLPVKFVSVTATWQTSKVNVSWTVADEQNVQHYVVERSTDGAPFTEVGRVVYKAPLGAVNNYAFTDDNPSGQRIQYRIRQVDIDGRFTLSVVVTVRTATTTKLALYPNPVQSGSLIQLTAERPQQVVLHIADLQGKVIFSQIIQVSKGANVIAAKGWPQLASGTYLLFGTIDDKLQQVKFSKH